jgi:protein-tyrosine-phosphatase
MAIEAMKERGYDLSRHVSKSLDEIPREQYEYVITMGCGDACPFVPARHREDWAIPDPKKMPMDEFRRMRDSIEIEVKDLLARIQQTSEAPDGR